MCPKLAALPQRGSWVGPQSSPGALAVPKHPPHVPHSHHVTIATAFATIADAADASIEGDGVPPTHPK